MKRTLLNIFSLAIFGLAGHSQTYVDIDATGSNDGSSWANAYTDPRDAFINAQDDEVIWIAEGKYIRQGTTDRYSVFGWLVDNLAVYGGFDGTETQLSQRDVKNNPTILSGNLGDDSLVTNNAFTTFVGPIGSNSNQIQYALIDGLIIQDGYSNNTTYEATKWGGGFVLQDYVHEIVFNNCTFRNNHAQGGGAMAFSTISVDPTVTVNNCIIEGNKSDYGSAFLLRAINYRTLYFESHNNLIVNNEVLPFVASAIGSICYLNSNFSGGIRANFNNATIANNVDNSNGNQNEKALFLTYASSGTAINGLKINNSIIYDNENITKTVKEYSPSAYDFTEIRLRNTISEIDSYEAGTILNDVSTYDPMFVDAANGNYRIPENSPAADSGTTVAVSYLSTDLDGNARIYNSVIDRGCYEYQCLDVELEDSHFTCESSFVWKDGNTYTANNNTATYTIPTPCGNDSIFTLNLSFGEPSTFTDVQTALNSYTWIDGNTYTSSNNTATYTLTNAVGCDSVITLNLTINTNGIDEDANQRLSVYPNPTNGVLTVKSNLEVTDIRVIDFAGRIILKEINSDQIDLTPFESGVYFIEMHTHEGAVVQRVMKH